MQGNTDFMCCPECFAKHSGSNKFMHRMLSKKYKLANMTKDEDFTDYNNHLPCNGRL